jgi:PTS system nitrogen regulatory IIA component
MDLNTQEIAELLNVSKGTVIHWIEEGKIPAYKISDDYRFSRRDIEDWIMQNQQETDKIGQGEEVRENGLNQYSLFRAIHRGFVFDDIPGSTKEELIRNTTARLSEQLEIDAELLGDLLCDRERMMSTGLGRGIAVPHARDFLLSTHYDVLAVVYPEEAIEYDSLDGEPVHTMFFLFACEDRRHLNILAKIAHLVNQTDGTNFLQKKPTKERLLNYVKEMESALL